MDDIGDKLPINEFSLDEMVINPSILMIAKRGGGKSWITRSIVHKYKDIPVAVIISPTEKNNPFFSEFFPPTFIFDRYDPNTIKKIIYRQNTIIRKKREKETQGKFIDPRILIVMDDCLASKCDWAKDQQMLEFLFNGRHIQITYILTMQFPLGISPELRTNFDYVFLLADDTTSNVKRIYDHYAGMFPDFNTFRTVFNQLTENFGAMVIKNRGERKTILDKISFYKAPDLKNVPLEFGCTQFRTFHKKNFNEKWDEKKFQLDYNEYLFDKKKSRSKIDVKKLFKY